MVTMDGGWDGDLLQAGVDELQKGHLGRCVLHGDTVRGQFQVLVTTKIVDARATKRVQGLLEVC